MENKSLDSLYAEKLLLNIESLEREVEQWQRACGHYNGENDKLKAKNARLREALTDMLSGWRYIRKYHGDLYGVGWDRCEASAARALEEAGDER